jgi:hypothetical protein
VSATLERWTLLALRLPEGRRREPLILNQSNNFPAANTNLDFKKEEVNDVKKNQI